MRYRRLFFPLIFFICPIFAAPAINQQEEYFKLLEKILHPPAGATAVSPVSQAEKDVVLKQIKQTTLGEDITVLKGDFSNEGVAEYAVIATGGTLHMSTVTIYKPIGKQLVDAQLDETIIQALIPGGDMSHFYLQIATPYAIVQKGKTYLRYMEYPGGNRDYDKNKLLLCSYVWQGKEKKFRWAGPELSFGIKGTTRCIH